MKWKKLCALVLASAMLAGTATPLSTTAAPRTEEQQQEQAREKLNFNQGWKFKRSYVEDAISPDFDLEELKKWENVNLPHSVRLEPYMNSGPGKTYQGDAMYVKHFPLSEKEKGKKLYLEFEGAMGVSDVWVNGKHMETKLASKTGKNTMYGGYLPFILDISDAVKYDGTDNVVTVHVNNEDNPDVPPGKPAKDLDFTYFGGIYRDVWLEVCEPVHITNANYEDIKAGGGILVDYPKVSKEEAEVYVQTHVRNEEKADKNVTVKTEIKDDEGKTVAEQTINAVTLAAGKDETFEQTLTVKNPKLWNLETPYMHTLVSRVLVDNREVDVVETPIGIRKIEMDRSYGLKINGEVQEALIGVNRHQEYAYIGYAGSSSLDRRDAIKFKESGVNVVRTGHYPQSKDFLDACDELGILVLEPTPGWQWYRDNDTFKNRVYNDIRQMVRRDRNRPCILAYETVLNESGSAPGSFTQSMARVAKEEHPSAKTATENSLKGMASNVKDEVSDIMYKDANRSDKAVAFQREYGDSYREQYSPENFFYRRVARGTGNYYPGGEGAMFMQAVKRLMGNQPDTVYYHKVDGESSGKGGAKGSSRSFLSMAEWADRTPTETDAAFIGSTSWIGIDHNRSYEDNMALCGLWDLNRIPKFAYYAMASQRDVKENTFLKEKGLETGPMLFISSYWTEKAPVLDKSNEEMKVLGTDAERIIIVYSNVEKVRLKVMKGDEVVWSEEKSGMTGSNRELLPHAPFEFLNVPYQTGTRLVAEGMDKDGKIIATQEVKTAGEEKQLEIKADDEGIDMVADGSDLMMLHAYVQDENGTVCNQSDKELKFTVVSGDAQIVGDGDKRVGANPLRAEAGITGVYLRAGMKPGKVVVKVEGEGLKSDEITINVQPMQEKAAKYTEIEYTGTGEETSCYLAEKEQLNTWEGLTMQKGKVTAAGKEYRNSLSVCNNMELRYALNETYRTLSGSVYVKEEDKGKEVVFRAYVDGVQKYVSPTIKAGEVQNFQIDVAGGKELVLSAEDKNADIQTKNSIVWLSPYLYEGKEVTDESELYQNLALGKPAEASSSVDNTTAQMGNDGTTTTIWRGEEVHEGAEANPQEWIVDLGAKYDVRNAKLGLEHDSITYTYEIYTSSDKVNWKKQITNTKSSQASNVIDEFTAKDVRYVKVRFTEVGEHADREQFSNATVSEFEIYKDMGVESTREYNLKELSIENKDIAFMPSTKEYSINLEGYESELRVKAVPYAKEATVKINGKPADDTVVLDSLNKDNEIVVEVTAKSGATTKYVVKVNGTLGKLYDSNPAKFKKVTSNGEENWYYAEMDKASGNISNIKGQPRFVKNGEFCMQGSQTYLRSGKRYMHPTNNKNAVRTFEATKGGRVQLAVEAQKYATNTGKVGISIQKNGEKVWPTEEKFELLDATNTVSDETIVEVNAGDKIHFIVDSVDGEASDATCLETTVRYLEDFSVTEEEIQGPSHVKVYNDKPQTAKYELDLKTDVGGEMNNAKAEWSLVEATEGVTINQEGNLEIAGDVEEGTVTIQAKSSWWPEISLQKQIKITKHQLEENTVYLSDLEWLPESDDTATGWGVVGKDKILSSDGSDETKLSLPNEKGERVYYEKGLGVNSYSEIIYDVKGKNYVRLESQIGIDYTKYENKEASVTFEVWADSEKIYDSGDMTAKTPSKSISLDISNAEKVKLVVTYGKDGKNGNDNADWADAKFIQSKDVTEYQISGNVDISQSKLTEAQGLRICMYAKEDTAFENVLGVGTTDKQGNYQINNKVRNGEYVLKINKIEGKCAEAVLNVKVNGSAVTNADFVLQKDPDVPDMLNTEVLEYTLELAETANLNGVIDSVVNRFNEAVANGKAVLEKAQNGDTSVQQSDIDAAWKEILDVMQYLQFKKGDKEELQKVVDAAHGIDLEDYLQTGQDNFNTSLANAEKVLADGDAMQEEVDEAWRKLLKAMSELKRKPDKSALEEWLKKASEVDREKYTEETLKVLDDAYAFGMSVYNDSQADEKEVKDAENRLKTALEGLKEIEEKPDTEDPGKPEDPQDNNGGGNAGNNGKPEDNGNQRPQQDTPAAKTGDTSQYGMYLAMMLVSILACAGATVRHRKRR